MLACLLLIRHRGSRSLSWPGSPLILGDNSRVNRRVQAQLALLVINEHFLSEFVLFVTNFRSHSHRFESRFALLVDLHALDHFDSVRTNTLAFSFAFRQAVVPGSDPTYVDTLILVSVQVFHAMRASIQAAFLSVQDIVRTFEFGLLCYIVLMHFQDIQRVFYKRERMER
jgi:hypothetical protein